jgi:hypothetical protein
MKDIDELEKSACKYWPQNIAAEVFKANPIQLLLLTQDMFLSILKCADASPVAWKDVLAQSTSLSANLFLKHLTVLTDIGGERLQRFGRDFSSIFPDRKFHYAFNTEIYEHVFSSAKPKWSNNTLYIDKEGLTANHQLSPSMFDVCMLLLWGANVVDNSDLPDELLQKCSVGQLIGHPSDLEIFVKQRYIYVSKITSGSTANDSGHVCEESCRMRLAQHLKDEFIIEGHSIKGISQNSKNLTTFDLVVTNATTKLSCAIEISFQVTTNSVIERKSLLAKERQKLLHKKGHKVAYIIDGSGNFQRRNAVSSILKFSDCSVNFSDEGILELANFIKENL